MSQGLQALIQFGAGDQSVYSFTKPLPAINRLLTSLD
jgi:hypothetical protein